MLRLHLNQINIGGAKLSLRIHRYFQVRDRIKVGFVQVDGDHLLMLRREILHFD